MSEAPPTTAPLADWAALLRPRQWSKNLLLFAAFLFTAGGTWTPGDPGSWLPLLGRASVAFVAFSALSSAGYVLNDMRDAALDREHPRKRYRPLASRRIEVSRARLFAALLVLFGLAVATPLGPAFVGVSAVYLAGSGLYTAALKRVPVLDVLVVAGLFALRALAGAVAIEVEASGWIIVCTFSGALFVAAVKREQERWLLGPDSGAHRETLAGTVEWPRMVVALAAAATVIIYSAYTLLAPNLPDDRSMLATVPLVIAALWRYRAVARAHPDRDAEEIAFRDPAVIALITGFVVLAVTLLARGGG